MRLLSSALVTLRTSLSVLAVLSSALLAASTMAAESERHVDNFTLLDNKGKAHELYYEKDAAAIVLIVQGNGCQVVRSSLADFKALRDDYASRGVSVYMLNSNLQDSRDSIDAEAQEWDIDIPILHDSAQLVGQSLNLTRTAEVLVIEPGSWNIVYRGALNNRVDYERQKDEASERYVRNTLDAMLAQEVVEYREVNAPGCLINFPDPAAG